MGFFELFSGTLAALYAVVRSYGLAIILLTLLVRILVLPLSIKATRSQREMQLIQPELKKLREKHKGNRQKMNEEMMKLYQEHGINPFGGCLPLLLQMPVLFGLFYVIRTPLAYLAFRDAAEGAAVEWDPRNVTGILEKLQNSDLAQGLFHRALEVNQFLGLRLDCSPSEVLASRPSTAVPGVECGTGFASGVPYLILVLLMGFTTFYQQRQLMARKATDHMAQQQQTIMKVMPVIFMVFAFSFPMGVVLYWITANVWTIAQQRIMLRAAPPLDASVDGAKAAKKAIAAKGAAGGGDGVGKAGKPPGKAKPTGKAAA